MSHSRSPDLHLAAYRALGLSDWTYERIECTAEQLPALVSGLDDRYIGLSVTMPGKRAALDVAAVKSAAAPAAAAMTAGCADAFDESVYADQLWSFAVIDVSATALSGVPGSPAVRRA